MFWWFILYTNHLGWFLGWSTIVLTSLVGPTPGHPSLRAVPPSGRSVAAWPSVRPRQETWPAEACNGKKRRYPTKYYLTIWHGDLIKKWWILMNERRSSLTFPNCLVLFNLLNSARFSFHDDANTSATSISGKSSPWRHRPHDDHPGVPGHPGIQQSVHPHLQRPPLGGSLPPGQWLSSWPRSQGSRIEVQHW